MRIGPFDYEVSEKKRLENGNGDRLYGELDYSGLRIRIMAGLPVSLRATALWHEVIHAILNQAARDSENDDEGLVRILANGITQVLKDNPEMGTL